MNNEEDRRDSLKKQAEIQRERDEAVTALLDMMPPLWWSLYQKSIEEGFKPDQAFSLVKCYVLRDGLNGVNVHKD